MNQPFRYCVHDGPEALSFELAGNLCESAASELERRWRVASSSSPSRLMIVDLSHVVHVDGAARAMLRRWSQEGAQFIATLRAAKRIVESITGQRPEVVAESARSRTWRPLHLAVACVAAAMTLLAPLPAPAAELKTETVHSWQQYVENVDIRNQQRCGVHKPFLSSDEAPGQTARLRAGEIVVSPAGAQVPFSVPSGLIHDWTGAAFIPDTTVAEVLRVVRDYGRYKEIYHPHVLSSDLRETNQWEDRFGLQIMNKTVVAKTALDSEYRAVFTRLDEKRWYSVSETTRVREIADYGSAAQHTLREDQGSGLIWRLHSIARFEERDGGVYVEIEVIALSRDIPAAVRWFVEPIVRRTSRSALATLLQQTADAVSPHAAGVSQSPRSVGAIPAHSFR